jgi:hypothetical protein
LIIIVFTLSILVSCNEELTDQDINVRVVNNTNCTLLIYKNEIYQMTLSPYTGNNMHDVGEGQQHICAKRDGDLLIIQDTYVNFHAGDEFTWDVTEDCTPLEN